MVCEDADVGRDLHGAFGDFLGAHAGIGGDKAPGRGQGVGSSGPDGDDAVIGFDDVAVAAEQEYMLPVGYSDNGLEFLKDLVGTPFFGEFHRGARQIAGEFIDLAFKQFVQGEGIGGGAGEAGQDTTVVHDTDLGGPRLHDGVIESDLTVAGHGGLAVVDESDYGG